MRYFAADTKGEAAFHRSPPLDKPAPPECRIPVADIRKAIPEGDVSLRGANADGHTGRGNFDRLKQRAEKAK